jgi:xylan 1,4-beta-xylosidase
LKLLASFVLLTTLAAAQAPPRVITADASAPTTPRDMAWQLCVGSAHAGLLASAPNLAQLTQVHRELGLRYVRFHGMFTDDMHVYTEQNGQPVYNFTKLDQLYDGILAAGMKPFVELSFMPEALASGTQHQFFWNANVTPPTDIAKWAALVEAFTRHMQSRYGVPELKTWYFEVWNEPNYIGFWPNTDQAAYFKLYDATAAAVKRVNPAYRVGGPATAGAGWVPEFLTHAAAAHAPVDFVSTHTYAVSSGFLDSDGNADLVLSHDPSAITGDVTNVRHQIDASPFPHLPLHITEWSASYSSRDPVHDSYTSAAFVLEKLHETRGLADSMSYWTYSDLFEENGPPPAAFHGGFGLLTRDDLPKATYFAYKYLNELGPNELPTTDPAAILTRTPNGLQALLWNYTPLPQNEGNKAFFRKLHPVGPGAPVTLHLTHLTPGRYTLQLFRTGYRANDAYSAYIDLGLPKDLTPAQLQQSHTLTQDQPELTTTLTIDATGTLTRTVPIRTNDIVLLKLTRKPNDASD